MSIGVVQRKLLWGRAGNRCAWSGCDQLLTQDLEDPETKVLASHGAVIGEEAHIRSGRADGPRHDPDFVDIDEYDNLLLLCPTHHTIIDKDKGAAWSTDALLHLKAKHEAAVETALQPAQAQNRALEERLAASVEIWGTDLLSAWGDLTWRLLQAYPCMLTSELQLLMDRGAWLLAKDWPTSHPKMAAAFRRWGTTVAELVHHVNDTFDAVESREDLLELTREHKRLYRIDAVEYERRFESFLLNCVVLWWLVVDLTQATNLVIKAVRLELDPLYRFDEGIVLLRDGDLIRGDRLVRLEYENVEWASVADCPSRAAIRTAIETERAARGLDRYDDVDIFALKA